MQKHPTLTYTVPILLVYLPLACQYGRHDLDNVPILLYLFTYFFCAFVVFATEKNRPSMV